MGDITEKLLDLEECCRKDIARIAKIQKEIESYIEAIPTIEHRLILYERYVNLKRWEDIAEDNHYSIKWVHVLHNRGLKMIDINLKQAKIE